MISYQNSGKIETTIDEQLFSVFTLTFFSMDTNCFFQNYFD